jgi:hypothetical protein
MEKLFIPGWQDCTENNYSLKIGNSLWYVSEGLSRLHGNEVVETLL